MGRATRNFTDEHALLLEKLESPERWRVLYDLRDLEGDWARSLVGAKSAGSVRSSIRAAAKAALEPGPALEAAAHLANAEKWQREIASYATGSGEGLAAMHEVRELQLAQAWLLVFGGKAGATRARELCRKLHRDREELEPNQRRDLDKVKSVLA